MDRDLSVKIVIGAALAGSHKRTMGSAKKSMKAYVAGIGTAIKQHKLFQRAVSKSDRMVEAAARREAAAGKLMASRRSMLVGGAAAYGMARLMGAAAKIEEQGLYLRTVINAPDKDAAVGRSMAHARKFSRSSLASQQEVLDIEYNLNSGGLSEEVSRAGSELVHKLAKVTKGVPGQVGKIFATTFNNLGGAMVGTTEEKMGRIADVLAKTQFKFQLENFDQLGQSMAYASATIASAKVNFEQSAAALGLLNGAGLEGSRAGTGFNAVMRNMTKAGDQLGFSMVRSADGTLDLIATLEGMAGTLDGLDIDERGDLLQKLFGDEGKAAIVPLLDGLDSLKEGTEALEGSAGTVNESYARFLASSAGQMTMFRQNVALLGRTFAGTLLPAVNMVLKPLARFAGWVAMGIEKFPWIGDFIKGFAVTLVALKGGMLVVTAAQWAWNAALAASPLTWIVLGIAVLGGAIYALWKNWDAVWAGIKKGAAVAWDFLKLMFAWSPMGLLLKAWAHPLKFIGAAWEKIKAVGRFLGIGGKTAVVGATAAVSAVASPLPSLPDLPPPASSGQVVNQDNSQTTIDAAITIHQQPGESAEDVAVAVRRELQKAAVEEQARDRRALHDG